MEARELEKLSSTLENSCLVSPSSVWATQLVGQSHEQFLSGTTGKFMKSLVFERHFIPMSSSPLTTCSSYIIGVKTVKCC